MQTAHHRSLWPAALVALGLLASGVTAKEGKKVQHPSRLHHALYELKLAQQELRASSLDYGGRKMVVLDSVADAIRHLEYLIGHPHYKLYVTNARAHTNDHSKHNTHIHHALYALREARHELRASKFDFGGQKETALRQTDGSIRELEHAVKHHKK